MNRFASAPWPLKAAYVAVLIAGSLALLSALAAIVALAGLRRLTSGVDLAAVPLWFWYFREDPQVRHWLGAGLVCALGGAGVIVMALVRGHRPPLHGAARWAGESELARAGLRARRGVVLGRKDGRLLVSGNPEHVLLYAPTRTGKGVGVVIPNLLTWPDSVVVLDVKGENWEASAGFRAAHGQEIFLFDPLDREGRTARYNPLGHIDRSDPIEVLEELQKIAAMLFAASDKADPFWSEAARTGFIGVGALVAETHGSSFCFGAIYAELTRDDLKGHLRSVLAEREESNAPLSGGCVKALSDFCSTSENTFASIKQTITSKLNLWLSPRVCAATEISDFDLRDLRSKRISIYLSVSLDNLRRVTPLYNLILQQIIDANTRERPDGNRHGVQVLLVLDEFARLGHASMIAHSFAFVAGYGLRLLLVLQSPAQLRAEYGPDLAEEIIANCGVEIAFAPKELKIAQDLSERLGYWTYRGRSNSRPSGFSSGRRSSTESDQKRALMMPQELMQMAPDRLLILRAGIAPARGRKITYWRERVFAARVCPSPIVPVYPDYARALAGATSLATTSAQTKRSPKGSADLRLSKAHMVEGVDIQPSSESASSKVNSIVDRYFNLLAERNRTPR